MDFKEIIVALVAVGFLILSIIICILPFILASYVAINVLALSGIVYWSFVILAGCFINAVFTALARK